MDAPHQPRFRRVQVSLRFLFLLVTAACLVVHFDPWCWKPPPRIPLIAVPLGETAQVDLIEISHVDSPTGPVFSQVIFWSYHADGQLHIRMWRLLGASSTIGFQHRRINPRWHECSWTHDGVSYRVRAPAFREGRSQSDPEIEDRTGWPKVNRIDLWTVPPRQTAAR